jgi:hypothetical protein
MAFSEKIKKEVMEKAGFFCCICQKPHISVEVHHILPQGKGGSDLIDNAAPLCPTCHDDYGGNPEKRARIKHIRDWWYEQIQKMYSGHITNPEQLGQILASLQNMNKNQESILDKQNKHDSDLMSLKTQLKSIANNAIDNMTAVTSDITTIGVLGTAVSSISAFQGGNIICEQCSQLIDSRHNFCLNCGNNLHKDFTAFNL